MKTEKPEKGLTHIYYGDGKGKTTAALGLAIRASGCGKRVVIVQFLKDWQCGELSSLELLPNVTVYRGKSSGGVFYHELSEKERESTKVIHNANLAKAIELHQDGLCDMLVLDEVVDAYNLGALDQTLLKRLLSDKPDSLELVITGHSPENWLLEQADYATEMVKRKHPYDTGVPARRGVEY